MPTYDYSCPSCGHDFSRRAPIAERDEQLCPDCGCLAKRPIRAPAISTSEGVRTTMRHKKSRSLSGIDTSQLPIVGPDGALYSADGRTKLQG